MERQILPAVSPMILIAVQHVAFAAGFAVIGWALADAAGLNLMMGLLAAYIGGVMGAILSAIVLGMWR